VIGDNARKDICMDINGINNSYLNSVLNNAESTSRTSGLEEKLNSFKDILDSKTSENNRTGEVSEEKAAGKDSEKVKDEELMNACKQFEAYFIEQVFKEMKSSVNLTQSEDPATKQLMSYYEDNLTGEYAKMAADQQENGLAQMLFEQMKRNLS
jgi:flagellar protein FlgJ